MISVPGLAIPSGATFVLILPWHKREPGTKTRKSHYALSLFKRHLRRNSCRLRVVKWRTSLLVDDIPFMGPFPQLCFQLTSFSIKAAASSQLRVSAIKLACRFLRPFFRPSVHPSHHVLFLKAIFAPLPWCPLSHQLTGWLTYLEQPDWNIYNAADLWEEKPDEWTLIAAKSQECFGDGRSRVRRSELHFLVHGACKTPSSNYCLTGIRLGHIPMTRILLMDTK